MFGYFVSRQSIGKSIENKEERATSWSTIRLSIEFFVLLVESKRTKRECKE